MTEKEIKVKKVIAPENLGRFSELMLACFGLEVSEAYFLWKYFKNPAGPLVGYEAVHNGKTIAFYGVIPEIYNLKGEEKIVYQSMDTMTHPNYQRMGLFVTLAKVTYDDILKSDGGYKLLGFPGIQSRRGFEKKLNWITVHTGHFLFINKQLLTLFGVFRKKIDIDFKQLSACDNELKEYLSNKRLTTSTHKVMNSDIINWKIFNNPLCNFKVLGIYTNKRLLGLCIYTEDARNTCQITWLSFSEQHDIFVCLPELCRYLFSTTKKKYLYTWSPVASLHQKPFKQSGFISNPLNTGPFSDKFPFIKLQKGGNSADKDWITNLDFDFQPLMLD